MKLRSCSIVGAVLVASTAPGWVLAADPVKASGPEVASSAPQPRSTGGFDAAIRGEFDVTSGESYGVVGASRSSAGAGVRAIGAAGGADLVLDGEVDARVSESGIDRPSTSPQTFDIGNSLGGGLNLSVDGATVFTEDNDGPGSGLDADTVDGLEASAFAPVTHDHDTRYFTKSELQSGGGSINAAGNPVSWTQLKDVPAGFADGVDANTTYSAGAGLGLNGSTFEVRAAPRMGHHVRSLAASGSRSVAIAIGEDGLPLIASLGTALTVARCLDVGCSDDVDYDSFSGPGGIVGNQVDIVTSPFGLYLVVYEWQGTVRARFEGAAEPFTISANGRAPSVAIRRDANPMISYIDTNTGFLMLYVCANMTCTSGNALTLHSPATAAADSSTSVMAGDSGWGQIAYRTSNTLLYLIRCANAGCGSRSIEAVAFGGYQAVIGQNRWGNTVFAHRSADLEVGTCPTPGCEGPGGPTEFSIGSAGFNPALAVATDGALMIAHTFNDEIRLQQCGNPQCASERALVVVAPRAGVADLALAIGSDGLPIIAYAHPDGSFVIHCSNRLCQPYERRW